MKRREFVEKLGIGSAGLVAGAAVGSGVAAAGAGQHDHAQVDGPLANATVAFGQWKTDPPIDRFPNGGAVPPSTNQHLLIPYVATIKAGGSVSFVLSGLHLVMIYEPGTTMADLLAAADAGLVLEPALPFGGFLNQPLGRVYRGMDPRPLGRDRVEVATLANPGTYLVACGVIGHLRDNMHGWIKVID